MAEALKPGAPLAFTYHHNKLEPYQAIGVAVLDAGLTCSASFPCPAEMGGSIHIHGTNSSIVDTVFVCRKAGSTPRRWLFKSAEELAVIISGDLAQLRDAGLKPTAGDIRCITFGHLARMTIWDLKGTWNPTCSTQAKLDRFAAGVRRLTDLDRLFDLLKDQGIAPAHTGPLFAPAGAVEGHRDAVAF